MFERHKLIVGAQLCMALFRKLSDNQQNKFNHLVRGPSNYENTNILQEWLPDSTWASVQALKVRKDVPQKFCIAQNHFRLQVQYIVFLSMFNFTLN